MRVLGFISLSSGSAGNCYFLFNTDDSGSCHGLLIDAGVSMRRLKKVFNENNIPLDAISAVLVTHDHLDHIRNLGSYCKYLKRPVYATGELHNALSYHTFTRDYIADFRRNLVAGEALDVAGFAVRYFVVPHDATQTVGFAIEAAGHRYVHLTDAGRVTDEFVSAAREADTVVVESNYDVDMLMGGPYTHALKMRICQGHGHLSNDDCASAICRFYHPGLKNLFLCHLSENNNTPELAYKSALSALDSLGVERGTVNLRPLERRVATPVIRL